METERDTKVANGPNGIRELTADELKFVAGGAYVVIKADLVTGTDTAPNAFVVIRVD